MPAEVLWEHTEPLDGGLAGALERRAEGLLSAVGAPKRDMAVLLCDDARIVELNELWRGESKPTDVLSFATDEGDALVVPPGMTPPLGDVAISLDSAGRQAQDHGWSLLEEVTFLLVHGVCHLVGHDHAEPDEAARMRAEEDRLLEAVAPGQARPPTPY